MHRSAKCSQKKKRKEDGRNVKKTGPKLFIVTVSVYTIQCNQNEIDLACGVHYTWITKFISVPESIGIFTSCTEDT